MTPAACSGIPKQENGNCGQASVSGSLLSENLPIPRQRATPRMSFFSKSQPRPADPRISIMREIEEGQPINPRHAQPASIDQKGTALLRDHDREAFPKTAHFGVRFNEALTWGGFRVQEIAGPKAEGGMAWGWSHLWPQLRCLFQPAQSRYRCRYRRRRKSFCEELSGVVHLARTATPRTCSSTATSGRFCSLIARATSDHTDKDVETQGKRS